jgi:uncharacterized protein (DUF1501 family)
MKLAKAFSEGLEIDRISSAINRSMPMVQSSSRAEAKTQPLPQAQGSVPRPFRDFADAAEAAARFMSAPDGPRIGALSYNGWDTHANEGVIQGQLGNRLAGLDAALRTLHEGLLPVWKDTAILVVTEFGRTARVNGTEGTDHGTGMAALLIGGAIKGGRTIADWPGLAEPDLYEGRDLKPTRDLRTVLKGVLRDHLGVPAKALTSPIFPESESIQPLEGLIV